MASPLAVPDPDPAEGTGADLGGWSALPLLGTEDASWLFVTGRSSGCLSRGPIALASFESAPAAYDTCWPFGDGVFQGIVIHGDAFRRGTTPQLIDQCFAEALRTSCGNNIFVVCRESRLPRRFRDLREYRRPSGTSWRRAILRAGRQVRPVAALDVDQDRLTGLTLDPGGPPRCTSGIRGDRIVLHASTGDTNATVLNCIVQDAAARSGIDLRVERVAVRKIGKTALFLSGNSSRRFILRIARSPIARRRARTNFDALSSFDSLPASLRAPVPRALTRGVWRSYEYTLEVCLDGEAGPSLHAPKEHGWPREAVAYIAALHEASAERVRVNDETLLRFVTVPSTVLSRACASSSADRVLARLGFQVSDVLRGRTVPLVRTHGDFTDSNCLYDNSGHLTGVVDWETSDQRGLPLVDLLQLMPVQNETGREASWRRFEAWIELAKRPERIVSDPVMGSYAARLGIESPVAAALVHVHWLTHVAERVEARRDDRRWMQLRVWQPLETLDGIFSG